MPAVHGAPSALGPLAFCAIWAICPPAAHAQPAERGAGLDTPRPACSDTARCTADGAHGGPRRSAAGAADGETGAALSAPRAPATDARPPPSQWRGARVELSYTRFVLSDGRGGGIVHAGGFGGYLPTGRLRTGAWVEYGVRDYALGQKDALARGSVIVGYQHLDDLHPVVPYAGLVGTAGLLFAKRFHTPVRHVLRGAGVELGADVVLVRTLWAGLSFSWIRATMRGLAYDLFALRVRVGL